VALVKFHLQEPPSVHVLSRGRMNWLVDLPLVHPPKPYIECSLQGPRGLLGTCGGRLPAAGGINKTACLALTLFLLSGRALGLCFQGLSNRLKKGEGAGGMATRGIEHSNDETAEGQS
jgi:hypothetical protein